MSFKEKRFFLWNCCHLGDTSFLGRLKGAVKYLIIGRMFRQQDWYLPLSTNIHDYIPKIDIDWSRLNPRRAYKRWKRRRRKALQKKMREAQS